MEERSHLYIRKSNKNDFVIRRKAACLLLKNMIPVR